MSFGKAIFNKAVSQAKKGGSFIKSNLSVNAGVTGVVDNVAKSRSKAMFGKANEAMGDILKSGKNISGADNAMHNIYRNARKNYEHTMDSSLKRSFEKFNKQDLKYAYDNLAKNNGTSPNMFKNNVDIGVDMAKSYFWNDANKTERAVRLGTAAVGAYGAGSYIARKSDGGTLTKNSKGERDIVGIPFI